jgi:hypothetical protein
MPRVAETFTAIAVEGGFDVQGWLQTAAAVLAPILAVFSERILATCQRYCWATLIAAAAATLGQCSHFLRSV